MVEKVWSSFSIVWYTFSDIRFPFTIYLILFSSPRMLLLIWYHLEITAIKRKIVIRSLYERQKVKKPIVIESSDFMVASQRELDMCLDRNWIYLKNSRSITRSEIKRESARETRKRCKIFFRYIPGGGGEGGNVGRSFPEAISATGRIESIIVDLTKTSPHIHPPARFAYSGRRLVKYEMQHTQKPQGCTYVNRQREGCRVCRVPLFPLLPWNGFRADGVVRDDASAWYVRIRVRDHEYFFYLIYYEFYVRPSEHLFVWLPRAGEKATFSRRLRTGHGSEETRELL